jgi:DNA polymerase-3 subunit delta'
MAYTEERAFELVQSAYERERLGHAFLITGEALAGGERLASRMIELINGADDPTAGLDLFGDAPPPEPQTIDELEGELVRVVRPEMKSRRISVKQMRELEKAMYQASEKDKWKVGIVLEADRMGVEAENAFLKTLEEPPDRCLLLLITSSPDRLLPTILSRCVQLPLITNAKREAYEGEDELLDVLGKVGKEGFGAVGRALTLKAAFSKVLERRKSAIAKANEAAQKEEVSTYKQTTEGDWLKQRENYYKALTESEYLLERGQFLDVLITWLGDVVRQKCGVEELDYPKHSSVTKSVAEAETLESLLQRMESLEKLGTLLETNVSEPLALEVGFMKAFG